MFVTLGSFFVLCLFPHCEAVSPETLLLVYDSTEEFLLLLSDLFFPCPQSSEKQLTNVLVQHWEQTKN